MKKCLWFFSVMIILIGLISGWSIPANADSNHDLQTLLPLSNQLIQGDQQIVLIHRNEYKSYASKGEFQKMGRQLSLDFELPIGSINLEEEHPVYVSESTTKDGTQISLRLVGMDIHSAYLIVKLEAKSENMAYIEKWQTDLGNKFTKLGLSVHWNVMIQGLLATSANQGHEQLWELLHDQLQISELNRYADRHTLSVSFYTSKLHSTILSGTQKMNLQVAVHQDSVSQQWRITIGTPIITIEY